jgi:Fe-Mn family superoxide dismutase
MQLASSVQQRQHVPPQLPYTMDALAPYLSREALLYHFGKHHRGYYGQFTALVEGTEFAGAPLQEIVRYAPGGQLYNAAAQVWNHDFFWRCLSPEGGGNPVGSLGAQLQNTFGSIDRFKKTFTRTALDKFGSGWTWLVRTHDGRLVIQNTNDAVNPLRLLARPLLACDVWEHAYYVDFRNDRAKYLDAFWRLVNWQYVAANLAADERAAQESRPAPSRSGQGRA